MTLQQRAAYARAQFRRRVTKDGETYWIHAGEAWVSELTRRATGDHPTDHWRMAFVVEALDLISDALSVEDLDPEDRRNEDATAWLASRPQSRGVYVDEAIREIGDYGTLGNIRNGQHLERREVLRMVLNSLKTEETS